MDLQSYDVAGSIPVTSTYPESLTLCQPGEPGQGQWEVRESGSVEQDGRGFIPRTATQRSVAGRGEKWLTGDMKEELDKQPRETEP